MSGIIPVLINYAIHGGGRGGRGGGGGGGGGGSPKPKKSLLDYYNLDASKAYTNAANQFDWDVSPHPASMPDYYVPHIGKHPVLGDLMNGQEQE